MTEHDRFVDWLTADREPTSLSVSSNPVDHMEEAWLAAMGKSHEVLGRILSVASDPNIVLIRDRIKAIESICHAELTYAKEARHGRP